MSVVICSLGTERNCDHVHVRTAPVSLTIENSQELKGIAGVGPAERTGKSSVTYWPGGTLATSRRRLPTKPGVVGNGLSIAIDGFSLTGPVISTPSSVRVEQTGMQLLRTRSHQN